MDFSWNEEQTLFREQVRSFIREQWSEGARLREDLERNERVREYQRQLADAGWLTMAWPEEYGGGSASYYRADDLRRGIHVRPGAHRWTGALIASVRR